MRTRTGLATSGNYGSELQKLEIEKFGWVKRVGCAREIRRIGCGI